MIFVFFVAVSFFMWVLKALNEKYEARISIAVTVTGVPNGIELEELEEGELEVIVHDNGTNLIKYLFTDVPPIKVDYSELNDNNGVLTMPVSALTNRASLLFDPSASLLHFNKELLTVRVRLEKKVLPVVVLIINEFRPHDPQRMQVNVTAARLAAEAAAKEAAKTGETAEKNAEDASGEE